jgi:hypothetical protein
VMSCSYLRGHRISFPLTAGIDDPARDRISRIKGMNDNQTPADFAVRRCLRRPPSSLRTPQIR